ncbi:MAG: Gfo/Idh/MocA family oxidoreductase [Epulopiscium sp.]|nr:Gfo/Idh/MocA family oxidoreductase [Candidatus Epulonipiscium sp.]
MNMNAAIIGCGAIHEMHARAIMALPNANLKAVVDCNEERAKQAAEKYDCKAYVDYKEMLKDSEIDVVHLCTPHYLHGVMAIDAMGAGKHVLTEKPIAINIQQGEEMIKVSKETHRHLCVCFQTRYRNSSLKVKEILDSGKLGAIKGIKGILTWYRSEEYYTGSHWRGKFETEGGGVLINQAIHTLDLMQWFGGEVEAIKGHVDTRVFQDVIEVEDTADAQLYFKNGARGIFFATNGYSDNAPIQMEIHCEDGILRIEDESLFLIQNDEKKALAHNQPLEGAKGYWGNSHKKMIERFYRGIQNHDDSIYVTGEEGLKALQLIEVLNKSSRLNKKIYL